MTSGAGRQESTDMRANRRVEHYEKVSCRIFFNSKSEQTEGFITVMTKNVSRGGLCFLLPLQLQEDSVLMLKIGGDEQTINAACEVRWCNRIRDFFYEAGVSFLMIDGKAAGYLEDRVRGYAR
jgi:hypothetical protein